MSSLLIILQLIDGILLLATEIPALMAKAKVLKGELQIFVDEDRSPTSAEWDAVNAKTMLLLNWMQNRADAAQDHLDAQGDQGDTPAPE